VSPAVVADHASRTKTVKGTQQVTDPAAALHVTPISVERRTPISVERRVRENKLNSRWRPSSIMQVLTASSFRKDVSFSYSYSYRIVFVFVFYIFGSFPFICLFSFFGV
jgi:hypothetical protein